ncbi:MAG: GNAT family N-acetyltransferase, partial [Flavobacteriaceae bacterium]|nr:GNAT family N-acetyltransferase [Flavobacteriaceae bacterium]
VGVLIFASEDRGKGYASQSIELITNYAFTHLNVHQVFANISADNKTSIRLFEKAGFEQMGLKKDWLFKNGAYKDEYSYQLIKP